jgi:hypothetical protein
MIYSTELNNTQALGITGSHSRALLLRLSSIALLLTACGGSSPPPASVTPAPSAATSAPATSATAATPPAAAASVASRPATAVNDKSKQEAPKSTDTTAPAATTASDASATTAQAPIAALTAARVAFLIDYGNSEAKAKAQAKCDKDPKKDDPAVKAACMEKARAQFLADVLVFKSDKKNNVTLTIYKRNDSNLKEVFVAPVSLKDDGASGVQVKFKGGSGQRPLFKNSNSPTLKMPNDYTIEIEDTEYGKLRYDAKIGLVDQ